MHDNYMHNSLSGQFFYNEEEIDNVHIYNNVIVDTNQQGAGTAKYALHLEANGGTRKFYIFNNTFYNSASGSGSTSIVAARGHTDDQAVVYSKNNIYFNTDSSAPYFYNNQQGGSIIYSSYDLFYGAGNPQDYPDSSYYNYSNIILDQNPLFVTAGSDFRLQSTSPARDAGTSDVSSVVTKDYDGIFRPQPTGGSYDIGAYEYWE